MKSDAKRGQERLRRAAKAMDRHIHRRLGDLRRTKVAVYLLLREFKRRKLYRHLSVPMAPAHRGRLAAQGGDAAVYAAMDHGPTWEDYLHSLGRNGISFGYFAELERLEERFGAEFIRLCGVGIPVETRRFLLRTKWRDRTAERIRRAANSRAGDRERIEQIINCAARLESEEEPLQPPRRSPNRRVADYWQRAVEWEAKLAELVEQMAQTPREFQVGPAYWKIVHAWRVVFERHVATGRRLARLCLMPTLNPAHDKFLELVEAEWTNGLLGARLHRDPPAYGDVA